MMTFIKCALILTVLNVSSVAYARSPSAADLSYNLDSQTLHVELKHKSKNPRDHYIRKIILFKNGVEIDRYYYTHQSFPQFQIKDIPIPAEAGDLIKIKAICNEAGYKEVELVVSCEEENCP